jgi:hypothetical protein
MTQAETPIVVHLSPLQARTASALAFRARMSLGGQLSPLQETYAATLQEIEQAIQAALQEA